MRVPPKNIGFTWKTGAIWDVLHGIFEVDIPPRQLFDSVWARVRIRCWPSYTFNPAKTVQEDGQEKGKRADANN
jgi:hypothetical protein